MIITRFIDHLSRRDPIVASIREAEVLLVRSAQGARPVADEIAQAIQDAKQASDAGTLTKDQAARFLKAYAALVKGSYDISLKPEETSKNAFEDTVDGAEILVRYAAECGKDLDVEAVKHVIQAREALNNNRVDDDIKARLYTAYASVSKVLGSVTAETIRSCSNASTRRNLRLNRWVAIALTAFAAAISLVTFAADSMSERIKSDIDAGGALAARLRAEIPKQTIDAHEDACQLLRSRDQAETLSVDSIAGLQSLAGTNREILSRTLKLNRITGNFEHNPMDGDFPGQVDSHAMLEINPAIANYEAEVFCKIRAFQQIRSFADNVRDNYSAFVGGITSYALPILYAMLGAYAFRLRNFADTIKNKTYHPSFADSARMITAVIAGAICGLFNPARGLSLSPLATAFLVGYGVELFFRFLDSLLNSFGGKS